jgi:hypothetical protein
MRRVKQQTGCFAEREATGNRNEKLPGVDLVT